MKRTKSTDTSFIFTNRHRAQFGKKNAPAQFYTSLISDKAIQIGYSSNEGYLIDQTGQVKTLAVKQSSAAFHMPGALDTEILGVMEDPTPIALVHTVSISATHQEVTPHSEDRQSSVKASPSKAEEAFRRLRAIPDVLFTCIPMVGDGREVATMPALYRRAT